MLDLVMKGGPLIDGSASPSFHAAVGTAQGDPAQRLGIPDRGLLRDWFKADIVVFDPATVKTPATKEDPEQCPVGIEYVVVNSRVVVDRGENTGELPGRAPVHLTSAQRLFTEAIRSSIIR